MAKNNTGHVAIGRQIVALSERIAELKAFGWKYCGHTWDCALLLHRCDQTIKECDCGLEEEKKVLE